jgi:UDP-N-acetylglucosamine:LPS N-acetylglucosamine transferase
MTVAELGCSGRATIYIPLAISRAHQGDNVKSLQENGAVVVCADDENLTACLERELRRLDEDRSKIEQLSSNYRDSFRNVAELPEDVISKELMEAASK